MTTALCRNEQTRNSHRNESDVQRQEAVCLMPVFFRLGYRTGEVGEGEGKMRMEAMRGRGEKNKQRMKADTEKHQLETTAAREPDRAWRNMIDDVEGEIGKK